MRFFRDPKFRWLIGVLMAGAFTLWLGMSGEGGLPARVPG